MTTMTKTMIIMQKRENWMKKTQHDHGKKNNLNIYSIFIKNKLNCSICRMTFRSYKPNDEELKKVVLEPAKPLEGFDNYKVIFFLKLNFIIFHLSVKEQVKEQLEAAKEKTIIEEVVRLFNQLESFH